MGISLNDILGFGNGSNRDGVYSGTLFEDGRRGVIDSYCKKGDLNYLMDQRMMMHITHYTN